jgi:hypothetical protein
MAAAEPADGKPRDVLTDYSWCKSGTLSDAGVRELAVA